MYKRNILASILQLCAAILLALPLCALADETAAEPESEMLITVKQIIAAQDAWFAEHGEYVESSELAELVEARIFDDVIFPHSGGVIHQYIAADGQAYLLVARHRKNHDFITATHTGVIISDPTRTMDLSAKAAVKALIWAEDAMFAQHGMYGSLTQLQDAELLGNEWTPLMSTRDGEVVLFETGAVVVFANHPSFAAYEMSADGGWSRYSAGVNAIEIVEFRFDGDYTNLLKEKASNTLRSVVASNAAYYAMNGEYNTLPGLTDAKFLDTRFGATDPADLGDGIRAFAVVEEGGQAYDTVSVVLDVMYVSNETGRIREFALGEPVSEPEIEELRLIAIALRDE